ncbi:MAG: hypothetical protein LBV27_02195 [Oscillospiraceae bacterium]|nr:hypothetical protein [Oscillospiraceae bacterium]
MSSKWQFPDSASAPVISGLPDPFMGPRGKRVKTPAEWTGQREYLKELVAHYIFGHMPPAPGDTAGRVINSAEKYDGAALEETVRITCSGGKVVFDVEALRPNKPGRFPVFVWLRMPKPDYAAIEREAIKRGFAIVILDRDVVAPDSAGQFDKGVCGTAYPDYDWRVLAMWAWGQCRVLDYLLETPWADSEKIIATGHSRFGKAALWAAVCDERFALCAAAGSGCGGTSSFRHLGGRMGKDIGRAERLEDMANRNGFWYWLSNHCQGFEGENIAKIPLDLHFIRALIAPRPLITVDGLDDTWGNPYGVQVSWVASQPVFEFLGAGDKNAIHFREGGHAYNEADWRVVFDFCDAMLSGGAARGYKTYSADIDPAPELFCSWGMPHD